MNEEYVKRLDMWQKTEQLIENIRRAALECSCTEGDGKLAIRRIEDTYKNIPLKYRVKKVSERRWNEK